MIIKETTFLFESLSLCNSIVLYVLSHFCSRTLFLNCLVFSTTVKNDCCVYVCMYVVIPFLSTGTVCVFCCFPFNSVDKSARFPFNAIDKSATFYLNCSSKSIYTVIFPFNCIDRNI